jgi:DNA (cytosine-5)-methyltransferase 1
MPITTVDLFCGCGGMSLGLQNAGFQLAAGFDNWEAALKVYDANFEHPAFHLDLGDDKIRDKVNALSPELIAGGPPCQDFSSAGHRNEKLGRADLTISFASIVEEVKPKFFLMENVSRIRLSDTLRKAVKIFKNAGYGLTSAVIDASYCEVPQSRKRFFMIGCLGSKDGFLDEILARNQTENKMTMADYFGNSLGVEYYFRIPRSYARRAVFSIYEPCVTIRAVDRPIPKNYKKHPNDLVSIGEQVRALTVTERSYVQTFPESYQFFGTKTNLNQMIGNAVPVKQAEFLGNAIREFIENTP